MRALLVTVLSTALAASASAGGEPSDTPRPPRSETAPKPSLDRPATAGKPVDGKSLCTYVSPDQNASSERADCIAEREPVTNRPTEKSPPGPPGNEATPSARR